MCGRPQSSLAADAIMAELRQLAERHEARPVALDALHGELSELTRQTALALAHRDLSKADFKKLKLSELR